MIGSRIKLARTAAGLSLRALAEKAEVSHTAIAKFEKGQTTPSSTTLLRLARALDTRTEFFFRPDRIQLEEPRFRKKASLSKRDLERVKALIVETVERFIEVVQLFPERPIEVFVLPELPDRLRSLDEIEDLAVTLREAWQLGLNPIPHLADALENHGLLVVSVDDTTMKFDGLAARVGAFPLIAVGANWPGDRQRFTMAHELGHLVLDGRLAEQLDEEKACNRFAGSFLVPRQAVATELGSIRRFITPRELYNLKHEWGLSMCGWVYRALDVGIIAEKVSKSLFRMFSSKGWKKREPGDQLPAEEPVLFEQLVLRALSEDMIGESKAAELLGFNLDGFHSRLMLETADAAAR